MLVHREAPSRRGLLHANVCEEACTRDRIKSGWYKTNPFQEAGEERDARGWYQFAPNLKDATTCKAPVV